MKMKKNAIAMGIVMVVTGAACTFVSAATQPPPPAQAGAPANLILTWSANDFYPSDYAAKALPANGTTVNASVEATRAGKIQDLKSVPIAWYLEGDWLSGGAGQKHASFIATKVKGASHSLRVVVGFPDGNVEQTISVPIVAREVVIETPYRSGLVASTAEPLVFRAVPYFFNISSLAQLTFSWTAGGQTQSANGDNELSVKAGGTSQNAFPINVVARGISSLFESASDAIRITIR